MRRFAVPPLPIHIQKPVGVAKLPTSIIVLFCELCVFEELIHVEIVKFPLIVVVLPLTIFHDVPLNIADCA